MYDQVQILVNEKDVTSSFDLQKNPVLIRAQLVGAAGYLPQDESNYTVAYKLLAFDSAGEYVMAKGSDIRSDIFDELLGHENDKIIAEFWVDPKESACC